jgi:hypothetical protein
MSERIIRKNLDLPLKAGKDQPEAIVELPTPVWSGSGTPANEANSLGDDLHEETMQARRESSGSDFHVDTKQLPDSDKIEFNWNTDPESPRTPRTSEEPSPPITAKPLSCQLPVWKTKTPLQVFKKPKHSTGDIHSPTKDLSVLEPWKETSCQPTTTGQPSETRSKKQLTVNYRKVETLPLPILSSRAQAMDGQLTPKFNAQTERTFNVNAQDSHSLSPEQCKKWNPEGVPRSSLETTVSQGLDGKLNITKSKRGKADFKKGKPGTLDINPVLPCNSSTSQRYIPLTKSVAQTTTIPASKSKHQAKGSETLSNHGTDGKMTPGLVTPKRSKMPSFRLPKTDQPSTGGHEKVSSVVKKS